MKFAIAVLLLSFNSLARADVAGTASVAKPAVVASNSYIECMASLDDVMSARVELRDQGGPDKLDVGNAVMSRYMRKCRHSSHIIGQLKARMKRIGYLHPNRELKKIFSASNSDDVSTALTQTLPASSAADKAEVYQAVKDMRQLAAALATARPTSASVREQTASLESPDSVR